MPELGLGQIIVYAVQVVCLLGLVYEFRKAITK